MDHLPTIGAGAHEPIEVPYVVLEDKHSYKNNKSSFLKYRADHGYTELQLQCNSWHNESFAVASFTNNGARSWDEVESFIQEWLFFGLLSEALGDKFSKTHFIKTDNGKRAVTTEKLPSLLRDLQAWWTSSSTHDDQVRYSTNIRSCLEEASRFVNRFLGSASVYKDALPLRKEVSLSIAILVSTLNRAAHQICKTPRFAVTRPVIVDNLLREAGWCTTAVTALERRGLGPDGMYCAALLGPLEGLKLNRDHGGCKDGDTSCLAIQVDESSYKTAHWVDHIGLSIDPPKDLHDCQFEDVRLEKVISIIGAGVRDPLITVSEDTEVSFSVKVQELEDGAPYVAVSHVWMDGLGCTRNALPRCRLRQLQKLTNSLYGNNEKAPIPFWVDTLCVPKAEEHKKYRTMAIQGMANTYRKADKILVLDAELFNNRRASSEASYTEIFLRIISTNWMRRLWTLLEGTFGRALYFAFYDGVVDMQDAFARLRDYLESAERGLVSQKTDVRLPEIYPGQAISRTVLDQYASLRGFSASSIQQKIVQIWNNMQWRSTSWEKDETLCMAIILDMDASDLGELEAIDVPRVNPKDPNRAEVEVQQKRKLMERYLKFLYLLQKSSTPIPRGLVFARGPKLEYPGFRWAPSSFFRAAAAGTIIDDASPMGIIDKAGLFFSAPGCKLYIPPVQISPRFVMIDETSKNFLDVDYETPILENRTPWTELGIENIEDPAIVLPIPLTSGVREATGILVSVRKREGGQLFANLLGRVHVRQMPAELVNWDKLAGAVTRECAEDLRGGLAKRLWNRRSNDVPDIADEQDLSSREWARDGRSLATHMGAIWAAGEEIPFTQRWCVG